MGYMEAKNKLKEGHRGQPKTYVMKALPRMAYKHRAGT